MASDEEKVGTAALPGGEGQPGGEKPAAGGAEGAAATGELADTQSEG